MDRFDVVVIGAGVFGAWTASHFARRDKRVLLIDAYGPGNARASSAGESRIIRMGYGADEIYTRMSQNSMEQWKKFFGFKRPGLFHETGVLWLAGDGDARIPATAETLKRCGVEFEQLNRADLEKRYPQINFDGIASGIFEPASGVLMARRAVAAVVEDSIFNGVEYRVGEVLTAQRLAAGRTGCRPCGRAPAKSLRRRLLFLLAVRGWGRFFPTCWASGFFRRGRRFIFLACRRVMRGSHPRRCPHFFFRATNTMGCPTSSRADSRLRSTSTARVSIPIRSRGL